MLDSDRNSNVNRESKNMKNILQRLLYRTPASAGRNRKIRGLSTAELVGIIVIVGILGALGGTYVNGLVSQANTNAGNQNANTLNTVAASVLAAGGTATAGAAAGNIDTTSAATAIASLNTGVSVNGVLYQMTPAISQAAITANSYTMNVTAGPPASIVYTYTGTTP